MSVFPPAGAIGSLTATLTNVATGDGQGIVGWTYTLNDAAAQFLAAGETRTEVYVVKITDDDGQFVTQNVTITITGTNDAPTVSAADASGAVTEDASSADAERQRHDRLQRRRPDRRARATAWSRIGGTLGGTLTPLVER